MESPVKLWRNQKKLRSLIGAKGTLVSWTIIRVPPSGFSVYAPYPVGVVTIGASRMTCQIVDWEQTDLVAGRVIELVIRRVRETTSEDVIAYGIKAKPVRLS